LGTLLLVATVVGSGIMADALSDDVAVSLLGNTIATGAILFVLITIFGPVSGAHFNPAVSFIFFLRGDLAGAVTLYYITVQIIGGILGTWAAHTMFEVPILQISTVDRSGFGNCVSEIIATFGLVFVIVTAISQKSKSIPMLVGMYISAAYWFTASTSFANPCSCDCAFAIRYICGYTTNRTFHVYSSRICGGLYGVYHWWLAVSR
jgi:glycerol uptake facilitator-like aquaporin